MLEKVRNEQGERLNEELKQKYADQMPSVDIQKDKHFLDSIPEQVEEARKKLQNQVDEKALAKREKLKLLIE